MSNAALDLSGLVQLEQRIEDVERNLELVKQFATDEVYGLRKMLQQHIDSNGVILHALHHADKKADEHLIEARRSRRRTNAAVVFMIIVGLAAILGNMAGDDMGASTIAHFFGRDKEFAALIEAFSFWTLITVICAVLAKSVIAKIVEVVIKALSDNGERK